MPQLTFRSAFPQKYSHPGSCSWMPFPQEVISKVTPAGPTYINMYYLPGNSFVPS